MADFSHLSKTGEAQMVDVTDKSASIRHAYVSGRVTISDQCAEKLNPEQATEIIRTARIAGVQAAKITSQLIPFCHQVPLTKVDVAIEYAREEKAFLINVEAVSNANTGVEMEAFAGAQIASLTVYDMIKAIDPAAVQGPFLLNKKTGGKAGVWTRN